MKYAFIISTAVVLGTALVSPETYARKVRSNLPVERVYGQRDAMAKGSQAISTDCVGCGEGYTLSDIRFSGYDKKASADKESFFITNGSDRTLTGVSFYIVYETVDSLQLHRRWVKLDCSVAPGETEKFDIRSWDVQKSFYYHLSEAPKRRRASPYTVRFDPVTIYLRYE